MSEKTTPKISPSGPDSGAHDGVVPAGLSGDPGPSTEERRHTRRLVSAGVLMASGTALSRVMGFFRLMESGLESVAGRQPRATLGTFGAELEKPRPRWPLAALAAAAVAVVVGFAAYLISASAGLNEPPVVAAVNSRDLGVDARALEQASGGLSPHRFSQAWNCARKVTDSRITGLAASSLDGAPALLVYTKSDGSAQVTVVTGCGAGTPSAGPSALLPR